MCLAVPGQLMEWIERDPLFAEGRVRFGGLTRRVSLQCVPEVDVGDYVLVHAGIAISRISPAEAEALLATLDELEPPDESFPIEEPDA